MSKIHIKFYICKVKSYQKSRALNNTLILNINLSIYFKILCQLKLKEIALKSVYWLKQLKNLIFRWKIKKRKHPTSTGLAF